MAQTPYSELPLVESPLFSLLVSSEARADVVRSEKGRCFEVLNGFKPEYFADLSMQIFW